MLAVAERHAETAAALLERGASAAATGAVRDLVVVLGAVVAVAWPVSLLEGRTCGSGLISRPFTATPGGCARRPQKGETVAQIALANDDFKMLGLLQGFLE